MRHLFYKWNPIKDQVKNKNIFLFLDYDGTLTDIRNTPEQAIISIGNRKLLEKLAGLPDCKIAIVSGRASIDLKRLINLKRIEYIGNHGFEMAGMRNLGGKLISRPVLYAIHDTYKKLTQALFSIDGVLIENKKFTLSVHYRIVSRGNIARVKQIVNSTLKPHIENNNLRLNFGREVIEIKPAGNWHKGAAAIKLLEKERNLTNKEFLPICIGDDSTDEDMFASFQGIGINIRVGKSADSNAEYYVENVSEVRHLLECIFDLKCPTEKQ